MVQYFAQFSDPYTSLKYVQSLNSNLQFHMKYVSKNSPEATYWIPQELCDDMKRIGDILFLDAQKRDKNKPE